MAAFPVRRKCSKGVLLGCILVATILVTLYFNNRLFNPFGIMEIRLGASSQKPEGEFVQVYLNDRYTINTPACAIERVDPWSPAIKKYFYKLDPPKCPMSPLDMLIQLTHEGYLQVDGNAKKTVTATNGLEGHGPDFVCQKREVVGYELEEDDHYTFSVSNKFTEFREWTSMDEENAEVKCMLNNMTVYHNYFYRIIRKPEIEKECETKKRTFLASNPNCNQQSRLSVLVVGIESLSKPNFLRQMPMIFDLITNNFNAIDMQGYNKVGHNSFNCLMPYLTGNSTDELAQGCWRSNNSLNNCTFLWDVFANAGYKTTFMENIGNYGLFFFDKNGKQRRVVHYNSRSLHQSANKHDNRNRCREGRCENEQLVEWVYKFKKEFANDLHYGHFWFSRHSQDDMNTAQHLDPYIAKLFKRMNSEEMLKHTLLIFMSDQGIQSGNFRETEMGRQEENLPFMYLMFPQWFQGMFPWAVNGLRTNRHRLITLYDLHRTLKDVLYCNYTTPKTDLKAEDEPRSKGQTLFMSISGNRTCDDAGIPPISCSCRENVAEIDTNTKDAKELAELFVNKLNKLTHHVRSICAKFSLKSIMSIKKVVQLPEDQRKVPLAILNTHIILIMVKPGNAKFEGTIQLVVKTSTYVISNDVRRINKYSDTSKCIMNNELLKSVCYCSRNWLQH